MMSKEEDNTEIQFEIYPVRLPKDLIDKLPKAKIREKGKPIQQIFREALEGHFKGLNL